MDTHQKPKNSKNQLNKKLYKLLSDELKSEAPIKGKKNTHQSHADSIIKSKINKHKSQLII